MRGRIFLVEDDESLGFVTQDNLENGGYEVDWSKTGSEAKVKFTPGQFDLCILDVMLPHLDGFSLASHIREMDKEIPILFLTAKSMEEDRLRGFEIGGDDYITKPFSLKELMMRIKVFIRRSNQPTGSLPGTHMIMAIGDYKFDPENLVLIRGEVTTNLTKMESDVLQLLVAQKNQLVKRSEILISIWGEDDYFKGRSLDVFISRLRKYLQDDDRVEIKNHHGVGFLLKCH